MQLLAVHLLTRGRPAGRAVAPPSATRPDPRVRRVLDHVHDHLALPLARGDLARVAGPSPFHFLRLFRDTTGEAPHRYLTRLRIEAARHHLKHSELPVGDVALLCGFSSPSHLASAFRRWNGCSPTSYRAGVRG